MRLQAPVSRLQAEVQGRGKRDPCHPPINLQPAACSHGGLRAKPALWGSPYADRTVLPTIQGAKQGEMELAALARLG